MSKISYADVFGKLDDVRIYAEAFSISQVRQLYAEGLLRYYSLQDILEKIL